MSGYLSSSMLVWLSITSFRSRQATAGVSPS